MERRFSTSDGSCSTPIFGKESSARESSLRTAAELLALAILRKKAKEDGRQRDYRLDFAGEGSVCAEDERTTEKSPR